MKTKIQKPQQPKNPDSAANQFAPFVILAAALILESCFIFNRETGSAGLFLFNLFFGLFGPAAYGVPIIAAVTAFLYRETLRHGSEKHKGMFAVILTVFLSSAFHIFVLGASGQVSLAEFWDNGKALNGGGIIGGLAAHLMATAFGQTFSKILIVLVCILSLSFLAGTKKSGIWSKIGELLFSTENLTGRKTNLQPVYDNREAVPPVPRTMSVSARNIETTLSDPFAFGNEFSPQKTLPLGKTVGRKIILLPQINTLLEKSKQILSLKRRPPLKIRRHTALSEYMPSIGILRKIIL